MSDNDRWVVRPGETRTAWRGERVEPDPPPARHIESDIAHTRHEMAGTIDEIQRRLDPDRVAAQVKGTVREATIGRAEQMVTEAKESARGFGSGVVETIRQNPIPAAIAAVGIGWLFMSGASRDDDRYYYGRGYESRGYDGRDWSGRPASRGYQTYQGYEGYTAGRMVGQMADQTRDQLGQVAGQAREQVSQAADQARERAGDFVDRAREQAGGFVDQAGDFVDQAGGVADQARAQAGRFTSEAEFQARRARYRAEGMLRSNPLAVGALALAAGVAVGMAIPETEPEHRLMGEARDNLVGQASAMAQQAVEKVGNAASDQAGAASGEGVADVTPDAAADRLEEVADKATEPKAS